MNRAKVGVLPATIDALAQDMWGVLEAERGLSVLLMLTAHDHFGPFDEKKIQALARCMEQREEHAPGKCRVGPEEFSIAVPPARPRR